ncbi:MAG: UbiD family decarboxylase [Chitinophagia bacterium]|jgi:4-hydroxy-3-polyprenylbenzoate decarboxylase|nr:UbiD family decarboxylase [Chitinophagia bacterium]
MAYSSLEACLLDLERTGQLLRIKEQVDPYLEMAAIHLRVFEQKGPAILFENVKGSKYRAASNIFGTLERSQFIFRDTLPQVKQLIDIKIDPTAAIKNPLKSLAALPAALNALPKKNPISKPVLFEEINISDLPLIHHWSMDGGAFVTLPQVYTEDADKPGIGNSNLGMYRIQLNGNDYILNKEIGLHYQLHRGIGVHQTKANKKGLPLKVSCFVGGPPAHSVAAVMPLPEGMSEMNFAGVLAGKRFSYTYVDGFCISTDADFVITGEVFPGENKPEGPFGDHLGYYSLQHPFPVMKVHKVYARKNAIWAFTVVGRPPQEDTSFGQLIHSMTGSAVSNEIPGLKEVHAVDAAGVHPLLLAIGSERYTPFLQNKKPAEILTIANHILGTGQLSLAKFVFITADDTNQLSTHHVPAYLKFLLERIDLTSDIHFYTKTTMDTLDYSGENLNAGSKVVIAAYGDVKRSLANSLPDEIQQLNANAKLVLPGIIALDAALTNTKALQEKLKGQGANLLNKLGVVMFILTENPTWMAEESNNFLWASFTRTNPSHDMEGVDSFIDQKHWGSNGPLIFDARIKKHHAPPVEKNAAIEKKVDVLLANYGY